MIVEDPLPDPAPSEHERLLPELFTLVVGAAPVSGGADEPGSPALWDYLSALDRRDREMAGWDRFFADFDLLLAPAMPMPAGLVSDEPAEDSQEMGALTALLMSQVKGCPMIVIPVGMDGNGVPFAAQLVGPRWQDERLLAIAESITELTGGFQRPPGP